MLPLLALALLLLVQNLALHLVPVLVLALILICVALSVTQQQQQQQQRQQQPAHWFSQLPAPVRALMYEVGSALPLIVLSLLAAGVASISMCQAISNDGFPPAVCRPLLPSCPPTPCTWDSFWYSLWHGPPPEFQQVSVHGFGVTLLQYTCRTRRHA
jgi:hypothetical protein